MCQYVDARVEPGLSGRAVSALKFEHLQSLNALLIHICLMAKDVDYVFEYSLVHFSSSENYLFSLLAYLSNK